MARTLAIDFGEKRIGLALSDESNTIAFEYEIWAANDFFKKINQLVTEKEVETVVLGYPLNVSGKETEKTKEVLEFKQQLEKHLLSIPVVLLDERFSSQMASKLSGRKTGIDGLAAQIFLQNYLNMQKNNIH